jgi:hypothetical protein
MPFSIISSSPFTLKLLEEFDLVREGQALQDLQEVTSLVIGDHEDEHGDVNVHVIRLVVIVLLIMQGFSKLLVDLHLLLHHQILLPMSPLQIASSLAT